MQVFFFPELCKRQTAWAPGLAGVVLGLLCPDKAHLSGLGLPQPPPLRTEAASYLASGGLPSRAGWARFNTRHKTQLGHYFPIFGAIL